MDASAPSSMLRRARYGLGVIAALSAAVNLLMLVSPLYMLQVYDRVLTSFRLETLVYLTLIAAAAVLALGIFDVLRGIALVRIGRWWEETARAPLLAAALDRARQDGVHAGAALGDLQKVRGFVGSAAVLPFFDAPWTPLFLALIFLLHPLLGWLALASGAALLALAIVGDRSARTAQQELSAAMVAGSGFAHAALRNADVVHAMGMRAATLGLYGERQRRVDDLADAAGTRSALVVGISRSLRIGVQIAILGLGAWLVVRHELTGGGMIAASIILGRALAPVEQGIGAWRTFTAARQAHGRIRALLAGGATSRAPISLPPPLGKLSVEDLSLRLPGHDRPVLRNVSFRLEPGTVLAVVGPSAAGKSALCRLLVGSWLPSAGHVRLDGADIAHWREEARSRHVGYLPQNIELFSGTVRQNIARLDQADDAAVVQAARNAGCHEMILRLADGYDTEIGEGGAHLSGGQRQRLALARALFGDPCLIVLDEPNSNLDQEGEAALVSAIAGARERGAAIVLVNHRHAMMRTADAVAVLRDGVLASFGLASAVPDAAGAQRVVRLAGAPS